MVVRSAVAGQVCCTAVTLRVGYFPGSNCCCAVTVEVSALLSRCVLLPVPLPLPPCVLQQRCGISTGLASSVSSIPVCTCCFRASVVTVELSALLARCVLSYYHAACCFRAPLLRCRLPLSVCSSSALRVTLSLALVIFNLCGQLWQVSVSGLSVGSMHLDQRLHPL